VSFSEIFLDPITRYEFMERALLAALLVGAISGMVGTFVVVRGMSFFGDALAHSILPGVAIAFVYGQDLFWGGLLAGIGTALGIGWLTRQGRLKEDTAIGVVFAGMFALGIAIISTTSSYSNDLTHILFGNVLGVSEGDLKLMAACGAVIVILVILFYKELLVISFDPNLAQTLKLPHEALRLMLLVLVAVTIVVSLQAVGVSLMVAMLITPAATAQLLVKRLHHMIVIASLLGSASSVVGLYMSFHEFPTAVAAGPAMVLTTTVIFLIVFSGSQIKNHLAHLRPKLANH
jgi:ABC-type Mn2+/Zn2+ transport system permease subunit